MTQERAKKPSLFARKLDLGTEEDEVAKQWDESLAERVEARKKEVEDAQFAENVREETQARLEVERAARKLREVIDKNSPTSARKCIHGVPIVERARMREGKEVVYDYAPCMLCARQVGENVVTTEQATARKGGDR